MGCQCITHLLLLDASFVCDVHNAAMKQIQGAGQSVLMSYANICYCAWSKSMKLATSDIQISIERYALPDVKMMLCMSVEITQVSEVDKDEAIPVIAKSKNEDISSNYTFSPIDNTNNNDDNNNNNNEDGMDNSNCLVNEPSIYENNQQTHRLSQHVHEMRENDGEISQSQTWSLTIESCCHSDNRSGSCGQGPFSKKEDARLKELPTNFYAWETIGHTFGRDPIRCKKRYFTLNINKVRLPRGLCANVNNTNITTDFILGSRNNNVYHISRVGHDNPLPYSEELMMEQLNS